VPTASFAKATQIFQELNLKHFVLPESSLQKSRVVRLRVRSLDGKGFDSIDYVKTLRQLGTKNEDRYDLVTRLPR